MLNKLFNKGNNNDQGENEGEVVKPEVTTFDGPGTIPTDPGPKKPPQP